LDALAGIRILDLTRGIAGPAGILLLAEHGADVVKVEPPGGDPYRNYPGYRAWNRSRRSVALDLKSPEGKEQFLELLGTADVLAESFRPGAMAALGLDYESLADRFPQVIYLSIPAYPSDSRNATRPGWDALVQARSGQQYEQPGWRPGPTFLASPLPSIGALYLVPTAILAALHAREGTGRGQRVETSLYQGVLAFTTMLWVHAEHLQSRAQTVMTKTYPPGVHQAEVMECADGWIQVLPGSTQKKGASIHQIFDVPPDTPPADIYKAVATLIRDHKRQDVVDRMHEDLYQVAEILPTREVLRHPQIIANDMTVTVDDPEVGPTIQVGMPFRLSQSPPRAPRPRPRVGEHNAEVLSETHTRRAPSRQLPDGDRPRYPLDGIRVLDFGRMLAGPYAGMVLAGLGADVIHLATTADSPMDSMMRSSSVLLGCEQGKRAIRVDVKAPEGREVLRRLIERSDIVHHNLTKGVAERLGIDYESLRRIKPDIIYCNTYMYGPDGPLSHLGGNDSLAQALSGLEYESGPAEKGNPPLYYRFGHTDTTNALASVVGVLTALAHRDRTGEGQAVWTSLLNAAVYLNSDVYLTPDGASDPPKLNKSQTGLGALYRLYETQEGWIQVAAVRPEQWSALVAAVGRADLEHDERFATPEDRRANRAVLEAILEEVFLTQTAIQWRRCLDDAGIPVEISVNTVDGEMVLFDEDNVRLGLVAETQHPEMGRLRQVGSLIRFSDTPSTVLRTPPRPGEHTAELMRWLGYDEERIEALTADRVIAGP
jgi:crotonobetainyl-CoA:carnitine CoA-transferase CaiB-like acyl-CoA transferase